MTITLSMHDSVALLTWNDGENRINLDSLRQVNVILDELDQIDGPLALVLTGSGKFFSNGLDLDRFAQSPGEFAETATTLHQLFGRLITYPAYSVSAINGHAFAGGAMLTCTTDYRVMREDRGYWCLNEVELGLPLTNEMAAVVMGRLPASAAREAMLTARRFSAPDALRAGIVEQTAAEDDVVPVALARAAQMATKDRKVIAVHKRQAFGEIARVTGFVLK
jgi:enoyl-CoA hydratase/carnithine racemase